MKLRAPVNIKMLKQAKQRKPLRRARKEVAGGEEVGGWREGSTFSQLRACPEESHNSFMQKSIDI